LSVFPLARPIMHSILLVMVSRRERGLLKQSEVISLVVAIRLDATGAPIVRSGHGDRAGRGRGLLKQFQSHLVLVVVMALIVAGLGEPPAA
jgi:hypothetical protein